MSIHVLHTRVKQSSIGQLEPGWLATRRATANLGHGGAFWLLASTLMLLLVASTAPSPLYPVYQARWHFSALTLTAVFSVFPLALLAALLIAGRVSDHVGRRPTILVGLGIELAATLTIAEARGTAWLFAARALQGLGTGIAMSAIGAGLLDLQPYRHPRLGALLGAIAPLAGLSVGALVAGSLVQYAPDPMRLVFWVLLGSFILVALATTRIREPVRRRGAWRHTLRPRLAVARHVRGTFIATLPCLAAPWALGGLIIALGPSIMARELGTHNYLVAGLPIVIMAGVSAVMSCVLRDAPVRTTATLGLLAMAIGIGLVLVAVRVDVTALFLAGTAVAGLGYGPSYAAGYRSLIARGGEPGRGALVAAILTVAYLAFSLPALLAGFAATLYGLRETTYAYGVTLIAIALIAVAMALRIQDDDAVH